MERIREEVKRQLSEVLEYEAHDPRLRWVTIMDVRLSGDLRQARVYVSLSQLATERRETAVLQLLQRDRGFFRSRLARRLELRHTPELRFEIDQVEKRARRIEALLAKQDDSPKRVMTHCSVGGSEDPSQG